MCILKHHLVPLQAAPRHTDSFNSGTGRATIKTLVTSRKQKAAHTRTQFSDSFVCFERTHWHGAVLVRASLCLCICYSLARSQHTERESEKSVRTE
jgi:hypothetical protein